MSAEEIIVVVDADNQPIGEAPRARMRAEGLVHRATFIFVFDRVGRVLVQRRTDTKDLYPGHYDLAAGGVVLAGETYDESARREAAEELGLASVDLDECFDFYHEDGTNRCWGRVYACEHEGPFELQAEEVVSVSFEPVAEILGGSVSPVTPDTRLALERWLAARDAAHNLAR